jgi:GTPase
VIINDTVGFIRDLPDALVSAFRATLEEIADSDLLVHVADGSNPRVLQQVDSVTQIIQDLKFNHIPQLIVINKSDLIDADTIGNIRRQISMENDAPSVAVSALDRETIKPMITAIGELISMPTDTRMALGTHSA